MSMSLMAKAMNIKVGNPIRKLVLLKLADNANDKGECWPSYQHIADQCEIGRSTVKSHIRALEQMGMLRRAFRKSGELNQSNLFYLTLDNSVKQPPENSGAGDDLGQELPEGVGQELPEGGARAARGGGAGAAPITSHSFEPVIEPKTLLPPTGGISPEPAKKSKFDPLTQKPDNVSADVWGDWVEHRREIRHPLTPTTCKRIKSMLENHVNPDAVINLSIERGWQGLFPEKITEPAKAKSTFDTSHFTEEQRKEWALYELLEGR